MIKSNNNNNSHSKPLKAVTNNNNNNITMSLKGSPINSVKFNSHSSSYFNLKDANTEDDEDINNNNLLNGQKEDQNEISYPQIQQNVFTDLNLLISDDELPINEFDDEGEHDSCLDNVIIYSHSLKYVSKIIYVLLRNRRLNLVKVQIIIIMIMIQYRKLM